MEKQTNVEKVLLRAFQGERKIKDILRKYDNKQITRNSSYS